MSLMKSIKDFFFEYDTQTIDTSKITEEVNKEVGKSLGKKIDVSSTLELNKKVDDKVEETDNEPKVVDAKLIREAEEYNNIREINREDVEEFYEEPKEKIQHTRREEVVEEKQERKEKNNNFGDFFEEDDYEPPKKLVVEHDYRNEKPIYSEKKTYESRETRTNSYPGYNNSVKEKKFTPSLNISPVFGVLDEKKEVVKKVEITRTIVSNSPKNKPNIDDIRNKAYGSGIEDTGFVPKVEEKREYRKEEVRETNQKVYNVNSEVPSVKGVTLGDADEYYKDLGLAYNEDYKDSSKKDKKDGTLFDVIHSMYDKE